MLFEEIEKDTNEEFFLNYLNSPSDSMHFQQF